MKNDVDPHTMTLSEIYILPDYYFDPIPGETDKIRYPLDPEGQPFMLRTLYAGSRLKRHGKEFFTLKDDDEREKLSGEHDPHCIVCKEWSDNDWKKRGLLGEETGWHHP